MVERIVRNASLTLDFAPAADAPEEVEGRQTVYVHVVVVGANRDLVSAVVGLGKEITATTDTGQTVALRSYVSGEGASPDGRSWRTYMLAHDVDLKARQLVDLRGELLMYPRAQGVRVEIPLRRGVPQFRETQGLRLTLKETHWENGALTATLLQEWSADATAARLRPEIPFGVTALSAAGVPTQASEGRSRASERKEGETRQTLFLVFPDLAEMPDRLSVESLVRTGTPAPHPFRLSNVPLPEGDDGAIAIQTARVASAPPSLPADLVTAGGGSLRAVVRVDGRPAGIGTLSLGLCPVGTGTAAWRWLSLPTDARGSAGLANVRPGRYRVRLRWSPGTQAIAVQGRGSWVNEGGEVSLAAGRTVVLPPLEWRSE